MGSERVFIGPEFVYLDSRRNAGVWGERVGIATRFFFSRGQLKNAALLRRLVSGG